MITIKVRIKETSGVRLTVGVDEVDLTNCGELEAMAATRIREHLLNAISELDSWADINPGTLLIEGDSAEKFNRQVFGE
jgi:hypothetical protein